VAFFVAMRTYPAGRFIVALIYRGDHMSSRPQVIGMAKDWVTMSMSETAPGYLAT